MMDKRALESISSIKHERVLEARSLTSSRGRKASGKILLFGQEQLNWAVQNGCDVEAVFVLDKQREDRWVQNLLHASFSVYSSSEGILKKISDTKYLVPVLAVMKLEAGDWTPKANPLVVLDGLVDFGNIGTVVRTASAFGIHEFLGTSLEFDMMHRKAVDASRGSVFTAKVKSFPSAMDTISYLKQHGYQIVVTTPHDSVVQSLADLEAKPTAIVFGNETEGVSQELLDNADIRVKIPMTGDMESLNVGVAAGISLYEMKTKLVMIMLIEKIRSSLGRNMSSAVIWMRRLFDVQLQESVKLTAHQGIMLMILKCDGTSTKEKLARDAGSDSSFDLIDELIDRGALECKDQALTLTPRGEDLLAQVWLVQEQIENRILKGFSESERETLHDFIKRILENCEEHIPFESE